MFGIGMPEMLLILAVALIVIGPKKLPELARSLGKALGEFKKATSELKESIQFDTELKEVKTAFDDLNREPEKKPQAEAAAEAAAPPVSGSTAADAVPVDEASVSGTADSPPAAADDPAATVLSGSHAPKEG